MNKNYCDGFKMRQQRQQIIAIKPIPQPPTWEQYVEFYRLKRLKKEQTHNQQAFGSGEYKGQIRGVSND